MISIATSVTRCIIPKDAQKVAFLLSKVLLFKKVPKSVNIWATFERTFVTANLKKTPNLVTLIETKKQKSDDHVSRGSQPANFYLSTYLPTLKTIFDLQTLVKSFVVSALQRTERHLLQVSV